MVRLFFRIFFFAIFLSSLMFVRAYSPEVTQIDPEVRSDILIHNSTFVLITLHEGFYARDLGIPFVREYSFGVVAATIDLELLSILQMSNAVSSIDLDESVFLFLQDSIRIINATEAHNLSFGELTITGVGESVCVIDTGVELTHPALSRADVVGGNVDCVSNLSEGFCFINQSTFDTIGHGTHVAGIVAASGDLTGIAPSAGVVSVKIFPDHSEETSMFALINGIDWCIEHSSFYNISVISMSLGTWPYENQTLCSETYPALHASVLAAVAKNISVVSATGNDEYPVGTSAPACLVGVIPVGSVDKDDAMSYFSNYASWVKLFAPGNSINSTFPISGADLSSRCEFSSFEGYCVLSGTSMATPMVSGAIATINTFLHSSNRTLSPQALEEVLYITGKPVYEDIWGEQHGYNFTRINVLNALMTLDIDSPNVSITFLRSDLTNNSLNDTDGQNSTYFRYDFLCNSSDWQLVSLSLTVSNNSGSILVQENSTFSSQAQGGIFASIDSYESEESFFVSCNSSDSRNNTSFDTLFIDNDFPLVEVISPLNGSFFVSSNQHVIFIINVTDSSSTSCFLSMSSLELPFVGEGHEKIVSSDFSPGTYSWAVSCFDLHNHTSSLENVLFSVSPPDSDQGSTSQGGGGGSSRKRVEPLEVPVSFGNFSNGSSPVALNLSSVSTSNVSPPSEVSLPPVAPKGFSSLVLLIGFLMVVIFSLIILKSFGRFL